jgi:hypothetical protein
MGSRNIGSTFDDWLREEGLYKQTYAVAIKRVLARQIAQEMADQKLSKSDLAKRMQTSRVDLASSTLTIASSPGRPSSKPRQPSATRSASRK